MPTTYTPNPNNDPTTYQLPSDLDAATAESVNVALRALADKGAHDWYTFAKLALVNIFSRGQVIDATNSEEPLVKSTKYPTDDPANGANKWKRILEVPTNGSTTLALYAGSDPTDEHWAIVYNAWWSVGDQAWHQGDGTRDSFALLHRGRDITWRIQPAGTAATWTQWPGTVPVGQPVGNVATLGEYVYALKKPRTTYLNLYSAAGYNVLFDGFNGRVVANDTGFISWPINLPPDAVILSIGVKASIYTPTDSFQLIRRSPGSFDLFTGNTAAAEAILSTATASSVTSGLTVFLLPLGSGISVQESDCLLLRWVPHNTNVVDAIRIDWLDPGPRNI